MTGSEKPQVQTRTVNDHNDDPDARPMLYDPIQAGSTSQSNQYLATVIICLGAAAAGTGLAWTSPVGEKLKNEHSVVRATEAELPWIASFLAIGAIVGALPCGILSDKLGRKKAAMLIAVPYILSYLIIVFAKNVPTLYVARFLVGAAIGGSCVVCPVYISEFAETKIRGTLGTCFQLFLTIGILFVFVGGAIGDSPNSWIMLSGSCLLFPVLNLIGLFFLPESPTWLLKNHQETEAATAIKWYWGRFCNAKTAIQSIKSELEATGGKSGGIRELFSVKANRKGFFICVMLMFFQQFSGINAVIFFAEVIFKAAGSTLAPKYCSIIIGVVQVLMTFGAAILVERAGRKVLLVFSSAVMCLCLGALAGYFYLKDHNIVDVSKIGTIPLISLVVFIICFSLGYGPIPWMMMGEMIGGDVRGIATSLTVEFNWISVFIVTNSFGPLKNVIGDALTFGIFAVIMAIGTVYGVLCLFETKGKSNTEIQMRLAK